METNRPKLVAIADSRIEGPRAVLENAVEKADTYDAVIVVVQTRGPEGKILWDASSNTNVETLLCLLTTTLFRLQCMFNGVELK